MPEKIVVLDPFSNEWVNSIRPFAPEGMIIEHSPTPGIEQRRALIADADYAIAGQIGVDKELLSAATRLKVLHKLGTGVDNFDLQAARERGVTVARLNGANSRTVAEFALGLMLSAGRGIGYGNQELKQGVWKGPASLPFSTSMLTGKVVGIVGFGSIGQELALLLRGFDCQILYTKRTRLSTEDETRLNARYVELDELLEKSDVVSLHCPLTPETEGLINAQALSKMKRSAILVNVARGGVIVEKDLISALETDQIQAVALDVFAIEPLPSDSPYLKPLPNLLLTPHLAAVASDNFEKNIKRLFSNISSFSQGKGVPQNDLVV